MRIIKLESLFLAKKVLLLASFLIIPLIILNAEENIPLSDAAAKWKAVFSYDPLTQTGYILRNKDLVRFKKSYPVFLLGKDNALRAEAIIDNSKGLFIPESTFNAISAYFEEKDKERTSHFRIAAIIIDPGHGGKDPGAIGEFGSGKDKFKIQEKDIALAVGKDVYSSLQEKWPEKSILITRNNDLYPTLDERVDMANIMELGINEAIIFISIHANASFNKSASGYEVWYLNPDYRRTVMDDKKSAGVDSQVLPILNAMLEEEYTTESIFLAKNILSGMKKTLSPDIPDRGLRAEEWFVVRNAKMPSVLIELGFVTNEAEARRLADPAYLKSLSEGIYNGISDFVEYFENRKGNPVH
ncbi:N-acetylmuramoyl-L-alanine amidase [Spirochaetota bacterium]